MVVFKCFFFFFFGGGVLFSLLWSVVSDGSLKIASWTLHPFGVFTSGSLWVPGWSCCT